MKRILIPILLAALLFAGLSLPAQSAAEDEHPITLTITCDPVPELEGAGTIPDLLFTIRNNSDYDYTLINAKLTGGYENQEMPLTESFAVMAQSTREFHLNDVPVAEDQLDREITYTLTWEEHQTEIDPETGDATFLTLTREASASITLERFVVPELTVTAACDETGVRSDKTFTVRYTIRNDTAFDITGIRLYDPEQSMQSIPLPDSDLSSGDSVTVSIEYRMGTSDMTFAPRVEYISRRREMQTDAERALVVESVVVDLQIQTEMRPANAEGTTFAITITNNGNRPVTDICVYDEINTLLEPAFSLDPEDFHTVLYTVKPAVSSDRVRTVRFHATALDCFEKKIRIDEQQTFSVVPYIVPDSVQLELSAVLQSPYYDENGKLCASIQFVIRNTGDVKLYNAVLKELTIFGTVTSYQELRHGETYFTKIYQLDGVQELKFRVEAFDPAENPCRSETIRLDLSGLRELADRKTDPVYVHTQNPFIQDLDSKYSGVLRIATIIGLSIAAFCAIICIVLYTVELRIRSKLPAEFEEDLERVLRATKRRTEKQLFSDAPTEQFGYTAPIKLRNYGELTEEEAKARNELYRKRLAENLRREGAAQQPKKKAAPERIDSDGTRVIPVIRRTVPAPESKPEPEAQQKSKEPETDTRVIPVRPRPNPAQPVVPPVIPASEPIQKPEPEAQQKSKEPETDTRVIPVRPRPNPAQPVVPPVVPVSEPKPEPEPELIPEPETIHGQEPELIPEPEPELIPESEPELIPEQEPISEPEPELIPEQEPISEPEPELIPEQERTAVDADPGVPPEPEPLQEESAAEPEPAPEAESPVGDADPGVPPEPETSPESEPSPEEEPTPEPEPAPEAESPVGDADPGVPPEPETSPESEPSPEEEPTPEPEPAPEAESPVGDADPGVPQDPIPGPEALHCAPRRLLEKPVARKRPAVLHPIRRMNG